MRTYPGLSRLALGALLLAPLAVSATPADTAFEHLAHVCIEDYLRTNPEAATALGDHRFDGRLSDFGPDARAATVATLQKELGELAQIDFADLTGANRIDAQILRVQLQAQLFDLTEERSWAWNPLSYMPSLADSIYAFVARDFAPPETRLHNAARRLDEIPRVVAQIEANLRNPPRIHTETAIQQTAGAIELVRTGLDPLLAQAPALKAELAPAQAKAIAALTGYKAWLEQVLPHATGSFRLGPELFRKKLRLTLDSNLSPGEILGRAERELVTTTDQMYATARPLYQAYFPHATAAEVADRPAVIRAVLDHLAQKHADDATVVSRVKDVVAEATAFVRSHDLITLPDTPLQVIVLPEFQRGVAIAYCDPPGALEPNEKTFFKVSPTPADWNPARKLSFFREYNDYMLRDLTVHEAMPGHYVQLAHSNQFHAPTLVRAIWWSGSFVEGWAVYAEQMMAQAGYGGPEVRMEQLKMRLRAIINAILDQKIQGGDMTEQQALDLMMKQGFQEEGEALGKWRRACQSSTQLSTYFVGAIEHDDMRAAAEKKEGAAFNLKRYNDTVTSFGSPPVKYVRQELGL
ncbi:MAG TPA: DUF885 domain-containing protein [Opitutaceae bacterium]|nr:DUF885 domain-containing protein [Opitutaceae bacterium]